MSETTAAAPSQTTTPNPASADSGAASAAAADTSATATQTAAVTPSILTEGEKPAATTATAAVPETYEFKAPEIEGKPVEVDTGALDGFRGLAKDAGLTQQQFQKLGEHGAQIIASRVAAVQQQAETANVKAFTDMVTAWGDQTKADPDLGGDKLPATLANVSKALDSFATPGMRQVLIDSGAGNHPEVIRFLSRIGALTGDPTALSTGKPAGKGKTDNPEQAARDFYNAGGGKYPDVAA